MRGLTPAQVETLICEAPPRPASQAVQSARPASGAWDDSSRATIEEISAQRQVTPRVLRKSLHGDLDRILGMCLRKEPMRRYASAQALGEDIDRFLDGKPILARPDTWHYRSQKFISRHRWLVAGAVGAIAVLGASLGHSVLQNRRVSQAHAAALDQTALAEQRLDSMRKLSRQILSQTQRLYSRVPEALEESQRLLQVLEQHANQLAELPTDSVAELCDLAELYQTLGETRFNRHAANLGMHAEAMDSYKRGLATLQRAQVLDPRNIKLGHLLSLTMDGIAGVHLAQGQSHEAARWQRKILEELEIFDTESERSNVRIVLGLSMANDALARINLGQGHLAAAKEHAVISRDIWAEFYAKRPDVQFLEKGESANTRLLIATVLNYELKYQEALELLRDVERDLRETMQFHSGRGEQGWILAARQTALSLQRLGLPGSLELLDLARQSLRDAHERSPDNMRLHSDLCRLLVQRASWFLEQEDWPGAEAASAEALNEAISFQESWPGVPRGRGQLGAAQILRGRVALAQGQLDKASEWLADGTQAIQLQAQKLSESWHIRCEWAEALMARGQVERARFQATDSDEQQRSCLLTEQSLVASAIEILEADVQAELGGDFTQAILNRALEQDATLQEILADQPQSSRR